MAITLVTGLPGHGKTLYTLARWKEEAEKDQRPVFHNGIKDLNIPGWQEWDVNNWQDLPAGALLVVDECQFVFPVRGRGQPPEFIEKLATHRHLGIDFVIITQNPMLIDPFVRRLIDRHFHVVRKFGTHFATIHEFANGCRDNVHNNRKDSIRHEWKYPKQVFEWYKSAEQHTVKRRIPARVFVLLAVPVVFVGLVFVAYQRLNPDAQKERVELATGAPPGSVAGAPPGTAPALPPAGASSPVGMTVDQYIAAHTPRVPDLPHTAPAYDDLTKPKLVPYPAACIASQSRCACYTQQATLMPTSDDLCRQIVEKGYFVAWDNAPAVPVDAASGPAAVLPNGAESRSML